MTPPRRRWFAFSLRTLFVVVTLVACWLGYGLNWSRQRDSAYEAVGNDGIYLIHGDYYHDGKDPPFAVSVFSPYGYAHISYSSELTRAELDRVRKLFPEAEFIPGDW